MHFTNIHIPIFLCFLLCFASKGHSAENLQNNAVAEGDSLALVALYNATNGENWTFNTNWLQGPVQSWHGIKTENNRVSEIHLFSNNLNGNIPPEIGDLSHLVTFYAYSNQLSGTIPPQIGQLTNLKNLRFDSNRLNGQLPPELGLLQNLELLYLQYNSLNGSIPPQIGQLSKLTRLYLYNNSLTGAIPSELGNMQSLQYLYLFSNKLNGHLPPALGQLSEMLVLQLHNNEFTGSIPPELGNLKKASYLYLQQNRLSGNIPPELGNMETMHYLRLESNSLSGTIPVELAQLTRLQQLYLNMNQLSGAIPPELGEAKALRILNLSLNQLNGSIPAELGMLNLLTNLDLSVNQLSGEIPPELGSLNALTQMLLDRNNLSGSIPSEFNKLTKIEKLSLASNQLNAFLPDSLHYLAGLQNIEVYYNNLTFEDFENKTGLFGRGFFYSPQNKIGQSYVVSVDTGANYTLEIQCGGTQNLYQWYFNNEALGEARPEANYRLENIQDDNMGSYHCKISNTLVPGLIIESEIISLQFRPIGDNEPTNIYLTKHSVIENMPVGTEVGKLSAEDEDHDDWHSFSLVEGEGDTDNESFFIAGNQLHTKEVFKYDEKNAFSIRIVTHDRAGYSFQKPFTITVERGTELIISDIQLLNNNFNEDIPIGYMIGSFTTIDNYNSLPGEFFYSLIEGEGDTDNKLFFIAANQLHSNSLFNYNIKNSFSIRVKTENVYGNAYEKTFNLTTNKSSQDKSLLIPDAFSPNGDGINDVFEIQGLENYPEAIVEIYNRYGKLVYYHKNNETNIENIEKYWWNGCLMVNGEQSTKLLPESYYFLMCKPDPHITHKKTIYLKH